MIVLVRGVIFLTTLTLIGISGLECFVLWPAAPETRMVSERLRRWTKGCLLGLLAATVADLLLRSFNMTGNLPQTASAIPLLLLQTHVGHVWILRGVLGMALLLIEGRPFRMILALALGVTIALTGHAADQGDFTFHVLMDSIHVIAAGLWVGGLFSLQIALRTEPEAMSLDNLARIIPRFSALAGIGLSAVVLGGIFNTWVSLPNISTMWNTPYGRILSMKLLAVSLLAACGAANRYIVLPDLKNRRMGADAVFAKWINREVGVALVVIGLTAVLCETIPARHALHAQNGGGARTPYR